MSRDYGTPHPQANYNAEGMDLRSRGISGCGGLATSRSTCNDIRKKNSVLNVSFWTKGDRSVFLFIYLLIALLKS